MERPKRGSQDEFYDFTRLLLLTQPRMRVGGREIHGPKMLVPIE